MDFSDLSPTLVKKNVHFSESSDFPGSLVLGSLKSFIYSWEVAQERAEEGKMKEACLVPSRTLFRLPSFSQLGLQVKEKLLVAKLCLTLL